MSYIGSLMGSFAPFAGNIIGAGVGMVTGWVIDKAFNADVFWGKSAVDWAKEGAGWIADRAVELGEWVSNTASDVWDSATDFVEEAWDTTTDFIEDTGEAIGNLLEDAGNAIGSFFSGLFA